MKIRIRQLWKIPVYCIAAGYLVFHLMVLAVSNFAVQPQPDGSYAANSVLSTVFSVLFFALTLLIGYFLFRKMAKTDIFYSASIIVAALLIVQLMQLFWEGSSLSFTIGIYLAYVTEWSRIISQICYHITSNLWIGAFAICFAPYLFVLFGTKKAAS